MKFCLLLSLFCLALQARSQNSPDVGSAWLLAQPTSSTFNDACWPSNLVTVSSNATGLIFSADAWDGYGCGSYGLLYSKGYSFYIADGSEYGYMNFTSYRESFSIQFNYQLLNSSTMMLTFWFSSNITNTTDSIDVYYTNATVPSCDFEIMSVPFNTCPFGVNNNTFQISTTLGNVVFSLGTPNVPNCAGTQNIWAVLQSEFTGCLDVATENPFATFLSPQYPLANGINLTFPIQSVPNSPTGAGFQLEICLNCFLSYFNATDTSFGLNGMSTNATTSLTTIYLTGMSGYGCVKSNNECPPIISGNTVYAYDACLLNQTTYSVSDPLGGVLTFNFGNTPATNNCLAYPSPNTVFGVYQTSGGQCLSAADSGPTYTFLNQTNPNQGLLLTFGRASNWRSVVPVDLQVTLLCNSEQVEDVLLNPMMSVTYQPTSGGPLLQVTGSSPHACVMSTSNYSIW